MGRIILPIILALILLAYQYFSKTSFPLDYYYLTVIVGFIFSSWYSMYKQEKSSKNIEKDIYEFNKTLNNIRINCIEVYKTEKDRREIVNTLYSSPCNVIISTDFHPIDNCKHREQDDVAAQLYTSGNKSYDRIVSIADTKKDETWITKQLEESKNNNFHLYVIKNLPEKLLLPNFVLVKDGENSKLFITFPADLDEGGFGFLTTSNELINGAYEYLRKLKGISTKIDKKA